MTNWQELRTVALVGLDRRPLPASGGVSDTGGVGSGVVSDTGGVGSGVVSDTVGVGGGDMGPEQRALHLAALLGTARRAGGRAAAAAGDRAAESTTAPANATEAQKAPAQAAQLLDLMLSGSAGPATDTKTAVRHWFERCAQAGCVVPHRLLVRTLDYGTGHGDLRSAVARCIGPRGHWLARQRSTWDWAVRRSPGSEAESSARDLAPVDPAALVTMTSHQRNDALRSARAADPGRGRLLIHDVLDELNAAERSEALQCLEVGLGAGDDDLIETALDDRSKQVRQVAIELANAGPMPSRARRFTDRLGRAVEVSGRLRRTIQVTIDPPSDEDARDLPPDFDQLAPGSSLADRFVTVLAAGTPLEWWTETLQLSPAKIVAATREPRDDLLRGWAAAAVAQQNRDWAQVVFDASPQLALVPLVDPAEVLRYVERAPVADAPRRHEARLRELIRAVPGPWSPETSTAVLAWTHSPKSELERAARLLDMAAVMGERGHPDLVPELQSRLARAKADKVAPLERYLQTVLRQISLRSTIDEAFS